MQSQTRKKSLYLYKSIDSIDHFIYKSTDYIDYFSPTLYSGKLARIWSCTAGFDVITYALVKKKKNSIAVLT